MEIDTGKPVLVTGASGYVAGWVVKALLDRGLTVHAAVRDPENQDKTGHLTAMAEASPGAIRFFQADLLDEGSYAEAMAGCQVVFHTASPFTTTVKDPQKQLVDPAKLGTRNVLEEASRTSSVRRVVLTSSCAAIYADATDVAEAPGGILTEEVWNTTASLDYQPYSYSKTVAEQEAWKIAGDQDQWDLVVVNPSLVVGPSTNPHPTSESFDIVRQFGDGTMKPGAPRIGLGAVDVRDLAEAHVAAAFIPDAKGRHIISGHDTNILEMAQTLLDKYGKDYPLPRRALPKWLVWIIGPMAAGISRKFVSRNVDVPWRADNSKSKRELGVTYRPLKESMEDMFEQMIEAGYFSR
ncbi:MAG: NAD-dependent epimerase/dehydratase family protein [Xanthomonadales bacterium]|nr:NAD-dependent epimerase/dehydratase family protein [Xanthomonadales bacterium]